MSEVGVEELRKCVYENPYCLQCKDILECEKHEEPLNPKLTHIPWQSRMNEHQEFFNTELLRRFNELVERVKVLEALATRGENG